MSADHVRGRDGGAHHAGPGAGAALARQDALARTGAAPPAPEDDAVARAEARLREVLEQVTGLDAGVESLSAGLAAFAHGWEKALGEPFAELARAEALVRRLRRLEEALLELAAALRAPPPPDAGGRAGRRAGPAGAATSAGRAGARRGKRAAPAPPAWDADPDGPAAAGDEGEEGEGGDDAPPGADAAEIALKRLYRRLARLLHPDLAPDGAEQARLSDLMAKVNAAYAKGDRTALEVMAERVGAGGPPGELELTAAERLAHLERRTATLTRIAASLERERARLERSDTARLRAGAADRAAGGGDFVAETRAEVAGEAEGARADGLARLDRVARAAVEVARARRAGMNAGKLEKRGPTGARRAFDPLAESAVVRASAARLERRSATAAARALARDLEDLARAAPWQVALTALAFFAEEGGARPPEALGEAATFSARWDRLRAAWPGAPDLGRALAALPRHLSVGARAHGDAVLAGLQLASADLAAGVRIGLEAGPVAAVARDVLAALGPGQACSGCGVEGPARHLYRTRGLDALHGVVCPACGAVLRSYWRFGEPDGLEALADHALRLGLVGEVTATLAGTAIGFQLLPGEAAALTAAGLRRRFEELYLEPYEPGVPGSSVIVSGPKGPLAAAVQVAGAGRLRLAVAPEAGVTGEELLERLRSRIERRFRP